MVRMEQTQLDEVLQGCLDDITPLQQSNAALKNNRHYLHQCIEDLMELKRLRQRDELAAVAAIEEGNRDEEYTVSYHRMPPEGDAQ